MRWAIAAGSSSPHTRVPGDSVGGLGGAPSSCTALRSHGFVPRSIHFPSGISHGRQIHVNRIATVQRTYEILLSREFEKKAFCTRLLAAELLDPVPRMKIGADRPAQLYRLKRRRHPHLFSRPFGSTQPSAV